VFLEGVLLDEVVDAHGLLLADAVQAADALLDLHRIPREIEVDEPMAELEVASFGAAVGEQQRAASRRNSSVSGWRSGGGVWPLMTRTGTPALRRNAASAAWVRRN